VPDLSSRPPHQPGQLMHLQAASRHTLLHLSFLHATTVVTPITKLMNVMFFLRIYCGFCSKQGHVAAVCFAKFPDRKQLQLRAQQPAAAPSKGHHVQPSISSSASTHKGSSNKKGKWKEQQGAKKEALQAQVTQVQLLQSEVEKLRAQLANLTGKSSQPAGHVQSVPGPCAPPYSVHGWSFRPKRLQTARVSGRRVTQVVRKKTISQK
jgi:hypothetical protein